MAWLPERLLARFVVGVVDGPDLTAMSKSYRGTGSASYHAAVLLGVNPRLECPFGANVRAVESCDEGTGMAGRLALPVTVERLWRRPWGQCLQA